jgi:hypothetical protein
LETYRVWTDALTAHELSGQTAKGGFPRAVIVRAYDGVLKNVIIASVGCAADPLLDNLLIVQQPERGAGGQNKSTEQGLTP